MQVNNQNVGQIPKTYTGNCNCCSQQQQTVAPQPQYQQPPVVKQMPTCQPQVANVNIAKTICNINIITINITN